MPALLVLFCRFDTVNEWLHSLVVVTVRLHQIYDVEAIDFVLARVLHSEIVPLGITVSAVVVFQVEVVLSVSYFNGAP